MKLEPFDYWSARLIEIHGDEWEYFETKTTRPGERVLKATKTGHTKWWPRWYVDNRDLYPIGISGIVP